MTSYYTHIRHRMKIIKTIVICLFLLLTHFLIVPSVNAQSGCCSWHGGESYCDYSINRWVCVDGSYSPTCTCGGGGYQYVAPTPIPSCPMMSYYDSLSGSCKCDAGYISNGSYCISFQQYCSNTLGIMSQYDYGTGKCECMSGYVYSGGSCISGSTSCWNQYGYNSSYQSFSNSCVCNYGYIWNSSRTKCISEDQSCQDQLGLMTRYNSLSNTCDCFPGYSIQGGQCLPNPVQYRTIPNYQNTDNIIPTDMPTPTKTQRILIPTETPIPTSIITTPFPTTSFVLPSVVPFQEPRESFPIWIFKSIKNFLVKIFK